MTTSVAYSTTFVVPLVIASDCTTAVDVEYAQLHATGLAGIVVAVGQTYVVSVTGMVLVITVLLPATPVVAEATDVQGTVTISVVNNISVTVSPALLVVAGDLCAIPTAKSTDVSAKLAPISLYSVHVSLILSNPVATQSEWASQSVTQSPRELGVRV